MLERYSPAKFGSKNVQASLETLPQGFATTPRSVDTTGIANATRSAGTGSPTSRNEKVSWIEDGEENDEDDEDDDEVDDNDPMDEYEEELRGIAESHEAMSRDERRNGVSSSTPGLPLVGENRRFDSRLGGTKSFDSREKSDEIASDESSVSNEALPNDEDEEVVELLKYKQKITRPGKKDVGVAKSGSKAKRVPTVKKELSTQKEILAPNVTDVLPKKFDPTVEIVNGLDGDTRQESRYVVPVAANQRHRYDQLVRGDLGLEEEYPDDDTPADVLRKLDKRQPSELNSRRSYFVGGYTPEQEQERKLEELGIEEGVLAENLMELLTRLAEDPRHWERVHRLLKDVEGDMELSRTALLDSRKRAYSPDTSLELPSADSSTDSPLAQSTTKKPKKKKKKKKKKPRNRLDTTTPTSIPATSPTTTSTLRPPLLTTTSPAWPTTPAQWRLVAERLFGSPWSDDRQETVSNVAKVRYAATSKQRGTSVKDRLSTIDDKQRESLKALNDERQALMLQSAREYSQPRRLHYGKVNTHEKSSSSNHNDNEQNYSDNGSSSRLMDYDVPERSYQQRPISPNRYDRYGQYASQRSRDYAMSPVNRDPNDYDEIFRYPEGTNHRPFARTQQFRPVGHEYASTKTWQDSRYDYGRPWKDKSRGSFDGIPGGHWPWRTQSDYKVWVPRYQPWSRERNWQRFGNGDDEDADSNDNDNYEDNESPLSARNWQRNPHQQRQPWRNYPMESVWPGEGNVDLPSWQVPERPKSFTREILPVGLEKIKNPELSKESQVKVVKDKPVLPKITMKTWNSLTSDPATWPFKLTGAKAWPKDKNGKSYNPNAELVRKLGLDKQDRLLSSGKDNVKDIVAQGASSKYDKMGEDKVTSGKSDKGSIANAAKSSIGWPAKLSAVSEWSKSRENERLPQRDEAGNVWPGNVEADRKMWSGKSQVSPKISSVGAWVMPVDQSTWKPYELKETPYRQLSEVPRGRWPGDRNGNPGETGSGSWSSPKKEGSSPAWSQKINNDWNPGDRNGHPEETGSGSWSSPKKEGSSPGWSQKINNDWNPGDRNGHPEETGSGSWSSPKKEGSSPGWSQKINNDWSPGDRNGHPEETGSGSWSSPKKEGSSPGWSQKINNDWSPGDRNGHPEETGSSSWSSPKKEGSSPAWSQKINNDWNGESNGYSAGKSAPTSHSSTWPTKWRQFAYHKVTASPISKPGSANLSDAGRSRNSYIAMSAVSGPKYPNNEWRKNDIEEGQLDRGSNGHGTRVDQDDPSSQLRKLGGTTKEGWDKQARTGNGKGNDRERNENDPLEHQLEELRQVPYWNHEQLREQKRSNASDALYAYMAVPSTQPPYVSTNSSSTGSEAEKRHQGSTASGTQEERTKDVTK